MWHRYITKHGSIIRIAEFDAQHDALYVHCQSLLIETYTELYGDIFIFLDKRGLLLSLQDALPKDQLAHCIATALQYHKIKHLSLLGN